MGYAQPGTSPLELVELAQEAERIGYDSAWAAEAWGTDAVSVLAWTAAVTTSIKIGSAILQIPARTPANTAMTAATLDLLSGGRFLLGLGTSGPQVVEGWHGEAWGKPLAKTREYVEIAPAVPAVVTDDVESGRDALKQYYSFYVGGMGARGKNFYNDLMTRYGWEAEARAIQDAFLDGRQRDAAALVPDEFVDEVALVGPVERIRDRLP